MITTVKVVEAVRKNQPTKPVTNHHIWMRGFTGIVKINGEWVPYRKIDLAIVFKGLNVVIQVPVRPTMDDVLRQIEEVYRFKIERRDVHGVRIPTIHKGQSRTIALVARDTSPTYCGCVSIRLVNEETQQ